MRVAYINKEPANKIVMDQAQHRLNLAANILKDKVYSNLRSAIAKQFNRPVYKTGKNTGIWWTARDAGEFLRSVRVVQRYEDTQMGIRNIRIIAGNKKAYWATMYEMTMNPARGAKPFFRPALRSVRNKMSSILENGG